MRKPAAGLFMWRTTKGELEILLVHPGGPFYMRKDDGVWSIPKGEADTEEERSTLLEVAKREFKEETSYEPPVEGYVYVGSVKRNDGKVVEAWAFEGDMDPAQIKSNTTEIEWPPRSGERIEIPEVDRGAFFTLLEARRKLYPYLIPLLDQFEEKKMGNR